jgi:hypothetical protein
MIHTTGLFGKFSILCKTGQCLRNSILVFKKEFREGTYPPQGGTEKSPAPLG